MSLKKITIVYLPDGTSAVRQYKVPKVLIRLICIFFLVTTAFLFWASADYLELKKNIPDNVSLMQENNQYKRQVTSLAGRIDQINNKMAELKAFENKLKSMVNLDTGAGEAQFLGIGGSGSSLLQVGDSIKKSPQKLVALMHQSLDNLNSEISVQTQQKTQFFDYLEKQKSVFVCTPSVTPAEGWVSSKFGYRVSPFTNKREFHSGIDISSSVGTEIFSPADGVVSSVSKSDGLGNCLTINHGYGFQTVYGHLSKVLVTKGQVLKRGDNIAFMGNTGRSTGSHLHYEVRLNEVPTNPERYILN